ncbi:MAG TPA: hypothetical protein GX403_04070 [Rhodocyclaceae bacterium]|nr:hypothetical protein [Rhodocyclaceae bacterium]
MEVKPGYKRTEVGVIPEEWECLPIADLAAPIANAIVGGPFGSDLVSADYAHDGIPVIRGQNMGGRYLEGPFAYVTEGKANSLSANLAQPGDVVFTQRGTLGQVSLTPNEPFDRYLVSQSQMKVTLHRDKVTPDFLFSWFESNGGQQSIASSAIQTGVPHINLGILKSLMVPAPPMAEQRAIATALSDVDALLTQLDRLIAKKRDIKQAAMQQLLTGKTRLPGFGGAWQPCAFNDVLERLNVKAHQLQTSDYQTVGLHPVVDQGQQPVVGYSDEGERRFPCPPGGVVVFGDHTCIVKFVDFDFLVGADGTQVLRARPDHNTRFLAYELQREGIQQTGYNRHYKFLKERRFKMPPLVEQTAIATLLSDLDAELAALEARRDKTRALKQGMMQELLTGRTRLP